MTGIDACEGCGHSLADFHTEHGCVYLKQGDLDALDEYCGCDVAGGLTEVRGDVLYG